MSETYELLVNHVGWMVHDCYVQVGSLRRLADTPQKLAAMLRANPTVPYAAMFDFSLLIDEGEDGPPFQAQDEIVIVMDDTPNPSDQKHALESFVAFVGGDFEQTPDEEVLFCVVFVTRRYSEVRMVNDRPFVALLKELTADYEGAIACLRGAWTTADGTQEQLFIEEYDERGFSPAQLFVPGTTDRVVQVFIEGADDNIYWILVEDED